MSREEEIEIYDNHTPEDIFEAAREDELIYEAEQELKQQKISKNEKSNEDNSHS